MRRIREKQILRPPNQSNPGAQNYGSTKAPKHQSTPKHQINPLLAALHQQGKTRHQQLNKQTILLADLTDLAPPPSITTHNVRQSIEAGGSIIAAAGIYLSALGVVKVSSDSTFSKTQKITRPDDRHSTPKNQKTDQASQTQTIAQRHTRGVARFFSSHS